MGTLRQTDKRLRSLCRSFHMRRRGAKPPFARVSNAPALMIAPHPDDEMIGASGLIAVKRQAGRR